MAPRSILVGFVHVSVYVVLSFIWVVLISILAVIPIVAFGDVDLLSLGSTRDFVQALGPGFIGLSTLVQGLGLVALAALLAITLPVAGDRRVSLPSGREDLLARWKRAFALRPSRGAFVVGGGLAALTVGWLPSWILQALLERMPSGYSSTVELMAEQLREGDGLGRMVLLLAIVVGAPVFEELVFRGYLWEALERAGPPAFAWLGTSLLFAAYHQDPVHVVALLPTAFFIGWLRLASGSIWPAMAAHFVNNALSVVLILLTEDPTADTTMPLWLGLLGYGITCVLCAAAWYVTRRRPAPES